MHQTIRTNDFSRLFRGPLGSGKEVIHRALEYITHTLKGIASDTRSVIHHPANNSLVTMLARLIVMCITERAQRYLPDTRSDKT